MRDMNRITMDDAVDFRENTRGEMSTDFSDLPNVPRSTEEQQADLKAIDYVRLVRNQFNIKGAIDKSVYNFMKVDEEGYVYYKGKRISVRKGGRTTIKQLQKSNDSTEFLKMIGYRNEALPEHEGISNSNTASADFSSQDQRDLETVAPEQVESIKAKIRSFKVTEEWAKREREKAMKQLLQTSDENEKKTLNDLIDYYERVEVQAKRRYNEVVENQFKRVNEIIRDESRPLGERLKELFRRDGLTIGAIITAVGMTISALILALLPSSSAIPTASPSQPNPVKRFLTKVANWLLDVAKKALSALPGAIGSLIALLLKKAGELVLFLSEHLIIFFLTVILFVWEFIFAKIRNRHRAQ